MPRNKEPIKVKFNFNLRKQRQEPKCDTSSKEKSAAAIRQQRYRTKMAQDEEKMEKHRENEKNRHVLYRSNIKEMRAQSERFDKQHREKERIRQAEYRKKRRQQELVQEQKKLERLQTAQQLQTPPQTAHTKKRGRPRSEDKEMHPRGGSSDRVRQYASKVNKNMPSNNPEEWAATMKHVVKNATPRRKRAFQEVLPDVAEEGPYLKELAGSAPGRPTKERKYVKRALFAESDVTGKNKAQNKKLQRQASQYKRRQQMQKQNSKTKKNRTAWATKVQEFMLRNDVSRPMPNKRDVIKKNGQYVAKRHILSTKKEAFKKFTQENPDYPFRYTTFFKLIPREVRVMKLHHRRVCICAKDYNIEQCLKAINDLAAKDFPNLITTVKKLSDLTLCPSPQIFQNRICFNRECGNCGVHHIREFYNTLLQSFEQEPTLKWNEWKYIATTYTNTRGKEISTKIWEQQVQTGKLEEVIDRLSKLMQPHSSHIFRANFQHQQEHLLSKNLPLDHVIVHMDFSQNMALIAQDEIEAAHFAQKQVTLHPVYIIRHGAGSTLDQPILWKQSIIQVSDNLKHDSTAVYLLTKQIICFILNHPGAQQPKVLHRFSDNCAVQYKSKVAFSHIPLIKEKYGIDLRYHFTEAGHGKGICDGLGATIKHGLSLKVLQEKIVLNSAYDVYMEAKKYFAVHIDGDSEDDDGVVQRDVLYYPLSRMKKAHVGDIALKTSIPGTQSLHHIRLQGTGCFTYSTLSCVCAICIGLEEGPCYYRQFIEAPRYYIFNADEHADEHDEEVHVLLLLKCSKLSLYCIPIFFFL